VPRPLIQPWVLGEGAEENNVKPEEHKQERFKRLNVSEIIGYSYFDFRHY
jgi:hypothetical protein